MQTPKRVMACDCIMDANLVLLDARFRRAVRIGLVLVVPDTRKGAVVHVGAGPIVFYLCQCLMCLVCI